jgi:hypothetical protein
MARKKNELGDAVSDRILALMQAGGTAESITKQLRAEGVKKISRATIGRRMTELRPKVKKARAAALAKGSPRTKAPLPSSPEEIPEDADLATIDEWLRDAKAMADAAYAAGDLDGFGKMGRLSSAFIIAKIKATPPKPPDPSERPDMIASRERARDEFHKLVKRVLPTKSAS